jgi:endonuclease III
LILHGRYICKARKPDCPACVVRDLCAYPAKTTVEAMLTDPEVPVSAG